MSAKKALVFLNLGTPESYSTEDVGRYLRTFLMDPYVIDLPIFLRWPLVNLFIVPFRAKKSAASYEKIWTKEGSPLKYYSEQLVRRLDQEINRLDHGNHQRNHESSQRSDNGSNDSFIDRIQVRLAMRYGAPSLTEVFAELIGRGVDEISVFPAYPQYAASSTLTAIDECRKTLSRLRFQGKWRYVESYENHPQVLTGWVENTARAMEEFKPDHVLFSFHGLPKSHIRKISSSCTMSSCCERLAEDNRLCYRRQCYVTANTLAEGLNLSKNSYSVGFQSRLTEDWIQPFSDAYYRELPGKGIRRLLVVCPSFTIDCLETLEEVAIRGRDEFRRHGGEDLRLVPALNDSDAFVKGIVEIFNNPNHWVAG